jgi:CRISPR-associated exonuclease Cas4
MWGALFLILLAAALVLLWLAGRTRAATGLPDGRLVYADTTRWQALRKPLYSRGLRLTGRPDYVLEQGRNVIPVEVKSGRAQADGPYRSHLLQLAAYCALVEDTYGRRPPHGIVHYTADGGTTFEVDYTSALERELMGVLDRMRLALAEREAPRDHRQAARCRACSFRSACNERLA